MLIRHSSAEQFKILQNWFYYCRHMIIPPSYNFLDIFQNFGVLRVFRGLIKLTSLQLLRNLINILFQNDVTKITIFSFLMTTFSFTWNLLDIFQDFREFLICFFEALLNYFQYFYCAVNCEIYILNINKFRK